MEKYEKHFITVTDTKTIGLPVKTHYYRSGDLAYCNKIEPIGTNRVRITFESSYSEEYFTTTEERDEFIKFFKKKHREANSFGKNKP
jgi:hypothetical protein